MIISACSVVRSCDRPRIDVVMTSPHRPSHRALTGFSIIRCLTMPSAQIDQTTSGRTETDLPPSFTRPTAVWGSHNGFRVPLAAVGSAYSFEYTRQRTISGRSSNVDLNSELSPSAAQLLFAPAESWPVQQPTRMPLTPAARIPRPPALLPSQKPIPRPSAHQARRKAGVDK